jgi:competence protein ComEC
VIHNGQTKDTAAYRNFMNEVQRQAIPTVIVRTGNAFAWGCCISATVLNPSDPLVSDVNDNSIVLRVTYQNFAALLPGDISSTAENRILGRGQPVNAQVLKVAHHGSRYSSSTAFLNAVLPAIAVISVGTNSYGHPAPETIARLQAVGATIYRTDLHGTVRVESDGNTFWVNTGPEVTVTGTPSLTRTPTTTQTPIAIPTQTSSATRTATRTETATVTRESTSTSTQPFR